jgi:putative transposase
MRYLKGKMARKLFQHYEQLGCRYGGRHTGGRGYCVSTIGLDEEKIKKYVSWQAKQEKEIGVAQRRLFE